MLRTGLALLGVALGVSLGMVGCAAGTGSAVPIAAPVKAPATSTASPSHPPAPGVPSQWQLAHQKAEKLIAGVILPGAAVWSGSVPAGAAPGPFVAEACTRLVYVTRYATLHASSVDSAVSAVSAAAGHAASGSGKTRDKSGLETGGVDESPPETNQELTLTITQSTPGTVAIRVDAAVPQRTAVCTSSRLGPIAVKPTP